MLLAHVGPETRLVIAHSLGSVVAYEALRRTDRPVALITLGSPLGLKSVVYERLRPRPQHIPPAIARWDNVANRYLTKPLVGDIVAAALGEPAERAD